MVGYNVVVFFGLFDQSSSLLLLASFQSVGVCWPVCSLVLLGSARRRRRAPCQGSERFRMKSFLAGRREQQRLRESLRMKALLDSTVAQAEPRASKTQVQSDAEPLASKAQVQLSEIELINQKIKMDLVKRASVENLAEQSGKKKINRMLEQSSEDRQKLAAETRKLNHRIKKANRKGADSTAGWAKGRQLSKAAMAINRLTRDSADGSTAQKGMGAAGWARAARKAAERRTLDRFTESVAETREQRKTMASRTTAIFQRASRKTSILTGRKTPIFPANTLPEAQPQAARSSRRRGRGSLLSRMPHLPGLARETQQATHDGHELSEVAIEQAVDLILKAAAARLLSEKQLHALCALVADKQVAGRPRPTKGLTVADIANAHRTVPTTDSGPMGTTAKQLAVEQGRLAWQGRLSALEQEAHASATSQSSPSTAGASKVAAQQAKAAVGETFQAHASDTSQSSPSTVGATAVGGSASSAQLGGAEAGTPATPPPHQWMEYKTPQGTPYYHDWSTGTTSWERPAEHHKTTAAKILADAELQRDANQILAELQRDAAKNDREGAHTALTSNSGASPSEVAKAVLSDREGGPKPTPATEDDDDSTILASFRALTSTFTNTVSVAAKALLSDRDGRLQPNLATEDNDSTILSSFRAHLPSILSTFTGHPENALEETVAEEQAGAHEEAVTEEQAGRSEDANLWAISGEQAGLASGTHDQREAAKSSPVQSSQVKTSPVKSTRL